jgi:TetR/AcrR family transcriptional repressor of nem operon
MRYDAEHKQRTREKVLRAATKAIRADGPHRLGVADVMSKAGLTHGGFYAHFESKDDLIVEAIGQMFDDGRARMETETEQREPKQALSSYIDFYLSPRHRDAPTGCPIPTLAADLPRLSKPARTRFSAGVNRLRGLLAEKLVAIGVADASEAASSMLAELVGALSLARAEPDVALSDAILNTSKQALKARFNLEAVAE